MSNDVFTNQDEVNNNIDVAVEKLGIAPKKQTKEQKEVLLVKKNCKFCWGQGLLHGVDPKGKPIQQLCKCVRRQRGR
jgi:hypothetical protein